VSAPDFPLPDRGNPPWYYRLEIDLIGKKWLTANKRQGRWAAARMTKNWREIAAWRAHRGIGPICIRRAHVVCELRFSANRRRDPANWAPTAKAVVDGLVDAGVFPDDDALHVIGPDMRLGPAQRAEQLIVHIWPLGEV
jgi:crossover junction endodeoxyribonuclease RusA